MSAVTLADHAAVVEMERAEEVLQSLVGETVATVSVNSLEPEDAPFLGLIISKLSPIIGNLLERRIVQRLLRRLRTAHLTGRGQRFKSSSAHHRGSLGTDGRLVPARFSLQWMGGGRQVVSLANRRQNLSRADPARVIALLASM